MVRAAARLIAGTRLKNLGNIYNGGIAMTFAKILIVDDDPVIATLIGSRLEKFGYSLTGKAHSPEEALQSVSDHPPDLILMDILLGEKMDGIALARKIRNDSRVPIVFITGATDDATIARAKEVGPSGFIVKPFDDINLRVAIELTLGRPSPEPG
jgi:CheY-like chemotaxis protein